MFVVQITAPHFAAGVVLNDRHKVVRAAPIVKYMLGWKLSKIENYASEKNWKLYLGKDA